MELRERINCKDKLTGTLDSGVICEFYVFCYTFFVFLNLSKLKKKRSIVTGRKWYKRPPFLSRQRPLIGWTKSTRYFGSHVQ